METPNPQAEKPPRAERVKKWSGWLMGAGIVTALFAPEIGLAAGLTGAALIGKINAGSDELRIRRGKKG